MNVQTIIAIRQTLTCGLRDLGQRVTLSPGGPGRLTECLKCARCEYSVMICADSSRCNQNRK